MRNGSRRGVPATTLAGWAGRYESGAAVILRDGVLRLQQREGEGSDPMVALSDSVFAPGARLRVAFSKGARGTVMRYLLLDRPGPEFRKLGVR